MYQASDRPTRVERATDRTIGNRRSKVRARADKADDTWRRDVPSGRRVIRVR